ncbi:MAG: 23S rRNA (adenine(2503)-C(2))-methyltransferase RlmN [Planctomycetes bacterium]|nr:23S rRNA (adenine(2503)-C(2))-methyltransferase RlmN [Planctomycetota bacterium]
MPSIFDEPAPDLLARFSAIAAPLNVQRSLRAAYALEPSPWIGRTLREAAATLDLATPPVAKRVDAADGTSKLLVTLADGRAVECVLIPGVRGDFSRKKMSARNREDGAPRVRRPTAAACVSSQVGCAAGCSFCASGLGGLTRNLTAGEIVAQALLLKKESESRGLRLATVVFMGMGEPLHNVENVITAIRNLTHRHAGALPPGGITVSTVGIVSGMEALARSHEPPHLAVSLHAPDDATRASIVRTAPRLWPVAETLDAAAAYRETTGRYVTISYVLLEGVNDSPEHAARLGEILRGRGFHVNLIPHNSVEGLTFRATPKERAVAFWETLRAHGATVHIRRQRGAEEAAACGQLKRREAER